MSGWIKFVHGGDLNNVASTLITTKQTLAPNEVTSIR